MASPENLPTLLGTLTDSLSSAHTSLPDVNAIAPPADGISLLDTKNELLLSYLQNLVFLIILKLRSHSSPKLTIPSSPSEDTHASSDLRDDITKKLVELRIYLEKGVRPLEGKLQYQLDKLLNAANEADPGSNPAAPNGTLKSAKAKAKTNGTLATSEGDDDDDGEVEDEEAGGAPTASVSDLAHRPNPSAFVRPTQDDRQDREARADGVYKPPRITPTALPTTTAQREKVARLRPSHTVNDYIREEMDDAPLAEPSIGAGSGLRGKAKEREEERRGYEETRLIRLPEERAEKKGKKRRMAGDGKADLDGGLDFGGMGDADFGGVGKRRKRRDGGGGEGREIGEAWGKRAGRGLGRKRR